MAGNSSLSLYFVLVLAKSWFKLQVLNILASYGVPSAAYGIVGLHRTIEAFKHMFALRMNLGDPEFVNITNVLSDMLSPKFAAELRKTIYDNMTFDPSHYGGK